MTEDGFADVTVIIPAWSAENTIVRALESVARQTLRPRACVVVDDGSPDGTQAAALAYGVRMGGVALTVIRQDNAGAGAARNRGMMEARTNFVAFLDADDEWLPKKLARCMARLVNSETVLVAHDSFAVSDGRETRLNCASRFRAGFDAPYVELYRRGYIGTTTVVARRDAVLAAGGFDTGLPNAQDFDLWLAMLRSPGTNFEVFDEALSRYHITAGSIMSHIERRRRCCLEIALRYAPDLKCHPGMPLVSLWFRVLAIHKEAVAAHRTRGETAWAIRAVLLAPAAMVSATLRYLAGQRGVKRTGLKTMAR